MPRTRQSIWPWVLCVFTLLGTEAVADAFCFPPQKEEGPCAWLSDYDFKTTPVLLDAPRTIQLLGHVGLNDIRGTFSFRSPKAERTIHITPGDIHQSIPGDVCIPQLGTPEPRARFEVERHRELLQGTLETFDIVARDISEGGNYASHIYVSVDGEEGVCPLELRIQTTPLEGFKLSGAASAFSFKATQCWACWLREMLPLVDDTRVRKQFKIEFHPPAVKRFTENLKLDMVEAPASSGGTLTLAAIGFPTLRRQGDDAYLFLQPNPAGLSPGTYQGQLQIILPEGQALKPSNPDGAVMKFEVRHGPGVLLFFVFAGVCLYLAVQMLTARARSLDRLEEFLTKHLNARRIHVEEASDFETSEIRSQFKGDLDILIARSAAYLESKGSHPHRHRRNHATLLYRLTELIYQLRRQQDLLVTGVELCSIAQLQRILPCFNSICHGLRQETDPLQVIRQLEILRWSLSQEERAASRATKNYQPSGLTFVIERIRTLEESVRSTLQRAPISWTAIGAADVTQFVVISLGGVLVGAFWVYAYHAPTYGSSVLHYCATIAFSAIGTYLLTVITSFFVKFLGRNSTTHMDEDTAEPRAQTAEHAFEEMKMLHMEYRRWWKRDQKTQVAPSAPSTTELLTQGLGVASQAVPQPTPAAPPTAGAPSAANAGPLPGTGT